MLPLPLLRTLIFSASILAASAAPTSHRISRSVLPFVSTRVHFMHARVNSGDEAPFAEKIEASHTAAIDALSVPGALPGTKKLVAPIQESNYKLVILNRIMSAATSKDDHEITGWPTSPEAFEKKLASERHLAQYAKAQAQRYLVEQRQHVSELQVGLEYERTHLATAITHLAEVQTAQKMKAAGASGSLSKERKQETPLAEIPSPAKIKLDIGLLSEMQPPGMPSPESPSPKTIIEPKALYSPVHATIKHTNEFLRVQKQLKEAKAWIPGAERKLAGATKYQEMLETTIKELLDV